MRLSLSTFSLLLSTTILFSSCSKEPIYPEPPPPTPQKVVVGQNHAGGIVFYVDASGLHGLTVSSSCVAYGKSWVDAIAICDPLVLNGYSDWYLPSQNELQLVSQQAEANMIQNFGGSMWSSEEKDGQTAWALETLNSPGGGGSYSFIAKSKTDIYTNVRAVRVF